MIAGRFLLAAIGLATAITFFYQSVGYPDAAARMPIIYSVAVGLLSCFMVVETCLAMRKTRHAASAADPANGISSEATDFKGTGSADSHQTSERNLQRSAHRQNSLRLLGVIVLVAVYVPALFTLGYILDTLLFFTLALLLLRRISLTMAITGTLALIALICVVFIWFLRLPIPLLPPIIGA